VCCQWKTVVADDKVNHEFNYFAEVLGNYRALLLAISTIGDGSVRERQLRAVLDCSGNGKWCDCCARNICLHWAYFVEKLLLI
jgi:hypothetical protein